MIEIHNEVEINAPVERVWEVLTDLVRFPEWNPLFYQGIGNIKVGEMVTVSAKTATKDMKFDCKVIGLEPLRGFSWKFHVIHPVLFRGIHIFQVEPMTEQIVKFVDREQFEGLLLPLQTKDIRTNGLAAMVGMGQALKQRVESSKPVSSSPDRIGVIDDY